MVLLQLNYTGIGKRRKYTKVEINEEVNSYSKYIDFFTLVKSMKDSIPYWSDKSLMIVEEYKSYYSNPTNLEIKGYKGSTKRNKTYFVTLSDAVKIARDNRSDLTEEQLVNSWNSAGLII